MTKQPNDNKSTPRTTIGVRYTDDRIALIDAIKARRGLKSRSDVMRLALDQMLRAEFGDAA